MNPGSKNGSGAGRRQLLTRTVASLLWLLALALWLMPAGCGGDDPAGPDKPDAHSTLVIDPRPVALEAPWDLTGPAGFAATGAGDSTIVELDAGEYAIAWGPVADWVALAGETAPTSTSGPSAPSTSATISGCSRPR